MVGGGGGTIRYLSLGALGSCSWHPPGSGSMEVHSQPTAAPGATATRELPLPAALAAWASVPSAATTADGGAPNGDMPLVGPVQVLLDAIGGASDPPQFYTFFLAPTAAAAAAGEDGDEHEDGDVANGNHAGLDGAAAALWAFVKVCPLRIAALIAVICALL